MHPYAEFVGTDLWSAISTALNDLELNQDVEITTRREYVIGYLCQRLAEAELAISNYGARP